MCRRSRPNKAAPVATSRPPTAVSNTCRRSRSTASQTQQAFFSAHVAMYLVHLRDAHGLRRGRVRLLLGPLAGGAHPAQHRPVGHAQETADGPQAHAFQVQLQRLPPLLGRVRPAAAAGEVAPAAAAQLPLHAARQPVFAVFTTAAMRTVHALKLHHCSNTFQHNVCPNGDCCLMPATAAAKPSSAFTTPIGRFARP